MDQCVYFVGDGFCLSLFGLCCLEGDLQAREINLIIKR